MSVCEEDGDGRQEPPEPNHPDHQRLLDFWHANRRDGFVPNRGSFDPASFPRLLPRLAIIARDGGAGAADYRYRLAGSEIVARAGRDPTGKSFRNLYTGDYLAKAVALYDSIAESRLPHLSRQLFPIADNAGALCYDRLILPMSATGADVDRFILQVVVVSQSSKRNMVGSFRTFGGRAADN